MPAAVVNASPLIFLAKLGRLGALELFDPVVTTPQTLREVTAGLGLGYGDALAVQAAVDAHRISVRRAPRLRPAPLGLDPGELSVIALAYRLPGATAVLDDLAAIKAARNLGIRARSTAFLLLDNVAARRLAVDEFRDLLDGLLREGYFLAPKLYLRLVEDSARV